jgi:hypothetical protein
VDKVGRVRNDPAYLNEASNYFFAIAFTRDSISWFRDAGAGDEIFFGFASS